MKAIFESIHRFRRLGMLFLMGLMLTPGLFAQHRDRDHDRDRDRDRSRERPRDWAEDRGRDDRRDNDRRHPRYNDRRENWGNWQGDRNVYYGRNDPRWQRWYRAEGRYHHRHCTPHRCYDRCDYRTWNRSAHHRHCNPRKCHSSCRHYRNGNFARKAARVVVGAAVLGAILHD